MVEQLQKCKHITSPSKNAALSARLPLKGNGQGAPVRRLPQKIKAIRHRPRSRCTSILVIPLFTKNLYTGASPGNQSNTGQDGGRVFKSAQSVRTRSTSDSLSSMQWELSLPARPPEAALQRLPAYVYEVCQFLPTRTPAQSLQGMWWIRHLHPRAREVSLL